MKCKEKRGKVSNPLHLWREKCTTQRIHDSLNWRASCFLLHEPLRGIEKKPRTYREQARKEYLKVAKKRKQKRKTIRKGIKKQLRYLRRNLKHIKELREKTLLKVLDGRLYKDLLVVSEPYR